LAYTPFLYGNVYVERYQQYRAYSEALPNPATSDFLTFVQQSTPLANQLRAKWLYKLAQSKQWDLYNHYYQPSLDVSLQCFSGQALWAAGKEIEALALAKTLFLYGHTRPKACDPLFTHLLANKTEREALVHTRLSLALEANEPGLAIHLLQSDNLKKHTDIQTLNHILQNPRYIQQLHPGKYQDLFYVYGLMLLVPGQMDTAIHQWQQPLTRIMLNETEQQAFLTRVALYKATRNAPDTNTWFAKIKPAYYTDIILSAQIRYALNHKAWKQISRLIPQLKEKQSTEWQYWNARTLAALGQSEKAHVIYETLAAKRDYYGFLASVRIHKTMHFENESVHTQQALIAPFTPITNEIKTLYDKHQINTASQILNDFTSELPKSEQSAMAYWVATTLQWPNKAIYLANRESLKNQLALRFPLTHTQPITQYAKTYQIPPAFIYAIIRQESVFHPQIVSSAGARGLMQLMPQTAAHIAKNERLPAQRYKDLFNPQNNIHLGTAYLHQLSNHFHHHPVLMAAAYNAGPTQVARWLNMHPFHDMDIWIETIPFQETRGYLKNVVAFYAVYLYRMHLKPDLSLFLNTV
jgi:soluble lytic murein transglycosylase